MPKSDKKRTKEALERHEARYRAETSDNPVAGHPGTGATCFAAAVDWLRAEVKLATDMYDDHNTEWAEGYLINAAVLVAGEARDLAKEIRDEAGL